MSSGPKRPVSRLKAMPPLRQKRIDAAMAEYVKRPEGLHTSDDFIKAMARRGLYAERPRPGKDLLLGKAPPPVPSGRIQPAAAPVGSLSQNAVRSGKGGAATPAKDRGGKKPQSAQPKTANRGATAKPAAGNAGAQSQLAQQLAKTAIALSSGGSEGLSDFVPGHVPSPVRKPHASSPANNVQPKTNADQNEKAGSWVPETPRRRPEVMNPLFMGVPEARPEQSHQSTHTRKNGAATEPETRPSGLAAPKNSDPWLPKNTIGSPFEHRTLDFTEDKQDWTQENERRAKEFNSNMRRNVAEIIRDPVGFSVRRSSTAFEATLAGIVAHPKAHPRVKSLAAGMLVLLQDDFVQKLIHSKPRSF